MPQYEPMIFNDDAALLDYDDDDIELNDIQHLMQLQLPMPQYEPMIFNDAVALVDGEGIERNDMNCARALLAGRPDGLDGMNSCA
jgi:hypothetical protein